MTARVVLRDGDGHVLCDGCGEPAQLDKGWWTCAVPACRDYGEVVAEPTARDRDLWGGTLMPYVVTVILPLTSRRRHAMEPAERIRRVVATLEKARTAAKRAVSEAALAAPESTFDVVGKPLGYDPAHAFEEAEDSAAALPESGGTVGPLPDGTVIEVKPGSYNWLAGIAEDSGAYLGEDASCVEIIDAYNARQA